MRHACVGMGWRFNTWRIWTGSRLRNRKQKTLIHHLLVGMWLLRLRLLRLRLRCLLLQVHVVVVVWIHRMLHRCIHIHHSHIHAAFSVLIVRVRFDLLALVMVLHRLAHLSRHLQRTKAAVHDTHMHTHTLGSREKGYCLCTLWTLLNDEQRSDSPPSPCRLARPWPRQRGRARETHQRGGDRARARARRQITLSAGLSELWRSEERRGPAERAAWTPQSRSGDWSGQVEIHAFSHSQYIAVCCHERDFVTKGTPSLEMART